MNGASGITTLDALIELSSERKVNKLDSTYLSQTIKTFRDYEGQVYVCGNKRCSHFGDTTPESYAYSGKCLMCNTRHTTLDRLMEQLYNSCSKCGGEKDSEGWCSNYCMEGE